ncbi:ribonuclease E inhibitor RraB [Luteibacter aegosomatissinici]|uniref:ribonuclease E inhibitor RraB n=1 Tax=Luteibacter aegosomatissinici TaxID=2911539 RepID=UPI001FF993AC|nr:ribonuclease E inhibitor RraB [Luteibacter aegosomatissinici]UPG95259.1 ribonuclease E inhibitor RraB [Luteibacter aegosomatissinici]
MSIVKELIDSANADIALLRVRDTQGDVFAIRRPVDFTFRSGDERQAASVAGFLSDYRFAETAISAVDGEFRIVATIAMPVEQQEILSVSGFMQCIAALFTVTYDGWGAPIRSKPVDTIAPIADGNTTK